MVRDCKTEKKVCRLVCDNLEKKCNKKPNKTLKSLSSSSASSRGSRRSSSVTSISASSAESTPLDRNLPPPLPSQWPKQQAQAADSGECPEGFEMGDKGRCRKKCVRTDGDPTKRCARGKKAIALAQAATAAAAVTQKRKRPSPAADSTRTPSGTPDTVDKTLFTVKEMPTAVVLKACKEGFEIGPSGRCRKICVRTDGDPNKRCTRAKKPGEPSKKSPKSKPKAVTVKKRLPVITVGTDLEKYKAEKMGNFPDVFLGGPVANLVNERYSETPEATKTATKSQSKSATKSQSKTATKSQSKTATKSQSKSATKSQSKSATKSQSKSKSHPPAKSKSATKSPEHVAPVNSQPVSKTPVTNDPQQGFFLLPDTLTMLAQTAPLIFVDVINKEHDKEGAMTEPRLQSFHKQLENFDKHFDKIERLMTKRNAEDRQRLNRKKQEIAVYFLSPKADADAFFTPENLKAVRETIKQKQEAIKCELKVRKGELKRKDCVVDYGNYAMLQTIRDLRDTFKDYPAFTREFQKSDRPLIRDVSTMDETDLENDIADFKSILEKQLNDGENMLGKTTQEEMFYLRAVAIEYLLRYEDIRKELGMDFSHVLPSEGDQAMREEYMEVLNDEEEEEEEEEDDKNNDGKSLEGSEDDGRDELSRFIAENAREMFYRNIDYAGYDEDDDGNQIPVDEVHDDQYYDDVARKLKIALEVMFDSNAGKLRSEIKEIKEMYGPDGEPKMGQKQKYKSVIYENIVKEFSSDKYPDTKIDEVLEEFEPHVLTDMGSFRPDASVEDKIKYIVLSERAAKIESNLINRYKADYDRFASEAEHMTNYKLQKELEKYKKLVERENGKLKPDANITDKLKYLVYLSFGSQKRENLDFSDLKKQHKQMYRNIAEKVKKMTTNQVSQQLQIVTAEVIGDDGHPKPDTGVGDRLLYYELYRVDMLNREKKEKKADKEAAKAAKDGQETKAEKKKKKKDKETLAQNVAM